MAKRLHLHLRPPECWGTQKCRIRQMKDREGRGSEGIRAEPWGRGAGGKGGGRGGGREVVRGISLEEEEEGNEGEAGEENKEEEEEEQKGLALVASPAGNG